MTFKDSILEKILLVKREEITATKAREPLESLKRRALGSEPARGFARALRDTSAPAIIAEIKRASPSKGAIRKDLDPLRAAKAFSEAGAGCLSVLTDEQFFSGKLEFIPLIRNKLPDIPILRKDFIIDPYQVWETKLSEADALLLIVAALEQDQFKSLLRESAEASLDVIVEVHNATELERALRALTSISFQASPKSEILIGINNRDLKTFVTNIAVAGELTSILKERAQEESLLEEIVIVSESGIKSASDIVTLYRQNARAFLIGESLLRAGDCGENLKALIDETRQLMAENSIGEAS